MKRLKKILALALAMAMVLGMTSMAAFAAGHTISVNSDDTHEYKVFQVLTGTLSEQGSTQLGDAKWGADATAAAKAGSVADFVSSLENKTEQEIAVLVAGKVDTTTNGRGTVKKGQNLTDLETGYYVLVDVTELEENSLDTKSLHVVKVVNDVNGFTVKYGTTSDEKIITTDTLGKDEDDDPNTNTIDGEVDNVSVGDTVNYQITAKVPDNTDKYNYFYFVITDKLDTGLTFGNDIKVYKGSVDEDNLLVLGTDKDYQVKTGADANPYTFQIGLNDAKSLNGQDIIVTYSAVVNKDAELGDTANKNTSTVKFSNDPNHTYNGDPDNPKPGFPASEDQSVMGETPQSITETYTTGVQIQKIDESGKPLTGVKFTIKGDSTKKVVSVVETFVQDADGDYYKLTNGKYTKEAPVGKSMREADAGATEGYVVCAPGEDAEETINGIGYRTVTQADLDNGETLYILVNGTDEQYTKSGGTILKYKKTEVKTENNATENHEQELEVDANGRVSFDGLGAGTYTISETGTPAGYNTLEDITLTIAFDGSKSGDDKDNSKWTFTSDTTGDYDFAEGVYTYEILNSKGSTLPETGGIGTTIFYVVGAILVIGAGVVMITRRRMDA